MLLMDSGRMDGQMKAIPIIPSQLHGGQINKRFKRD